MQTKKQTLTAVLAALGMLVLILDSKTAVDGAAQGIRLCLQAAIPSLFPFFFLSSFAAAGLSGQALPFMRPILRLCRVPEGSGSILAVGLLGGYPMGARCAAQAYRSGAISRQDAQRLLGFCSNAGPAFIFGMLTRPFSSTVPTVLLWCIHIASALITGILLPGSAGGAHVRTEDKHITVSEAVRDSISVMSRVCAWIILFRVLLALADRRLLHSLPAAFRALAFGLAELTNGCEALCAIPREGTRFLLASVLLAGGGLCVTAQTVQVTSDAGLSLGMYLPGKLLQAAISFFLAALTQRLLFPSEHCAAVPLWCFPACAAVVFLAVFKKRCSNSRPVRV